MANEWETIELPKPMYPCRDCIAQGYLHTNKMFPENLRWYDGKGDLFHGSVGDVDEDGNPFESDRFPSGFYCDVCIGDMVKYSRITDDHFGPTLLEEMERRQTADTTGVGVEHG